MSLFIFHVVSEPCTVWVVGDAVSFALTWSGNEFTQDFPPGDIDSDLSDLAFGLSLMGCQMIFDLFSTLARKFSSLFRYLNSTSPC